MAVSSSLVLALLLVCGAIAAPSPAPRLPRDPRFELRQIDPVLHPSLSPLYNAQQVGGGSGAAPRADVDTSALVEKLRTIILEGDAENGIPVLDPFVLEGPFDTEVGLLSWTAQVDAEHVAAEGLSAVNLTLAINPVGVIPTRLAVAADVTLPELTASVNYDFTATDGSGGNLFGKGPLQITLNDVELDVTLTVSLINLNFQSLAIDIDLDSIGVNIQGLINGGIIDGIASMALSELANELFKEQEENLEQLLVDIASPVVEEYLANTNLEDVICPIVTIPLIC